MSNQALTIQDGDFEKTVLQGKGAALVDFWAEWCGPCKALGPVIDSLAGDFAGKLTVYKMDIDANPQTPTQFQVRGIPTVILFKDGKPVERFVGVQPKSKFVEGIKKHL